MRAALAGETLAAFARRNDIAAETARTYSKRLRAKLALPTLEAIEAEIRRRVAEEDAE
jgi:hypothetical protein